MRPSWCFSGRWHCWADGASSIRRACAIGLGTDPGLFLHLNQATEVSFRC